MKNAPADPTGPDLDQMVEADSAVMEVRDPRTGIPIKDLDGTPWTIELWSPESAVSRQYTAEIDRRLRKRNGRDFTSDELHEMGLERMTMLTRAWYIRRSGQGVPCDHKTVRQVYERWNWLFNQVAKFISDEVNFLGESQAP